jgi:hypothetical protein
MALVGSSKKQHRRVHQHGARNRHFLALAAGQAIRHARRSACRSPSDAD